jgi:hypothetical protein
MTALRSRDIPVAPPMNRVTSMRQAPTTFSRRKNRLVAEYALRGLDQSIAVGAWQTQLTESLPEELRGSLPTIAEIEAELAGDLPPESPKQGGPHV